MDRRRVGLRIDDAVFRAVHARNGLRLIPESKAVARLQRGAELAACGVILLSWLWLGDLLAAAVGLTGILLTQVVLVLLPTVAYCAATGGVVAELALRPARPTVLLSAAALGVAASIVTSRIAFVQELWLRPDPVEVEAMSRLAGLVAISPGRAVLALALAPAIAEEALFRGLVLGRLRRRFGAGVAVLISAAAFALVHRSPMRFFAPLLLGALLGVVCVRARSIVPAMLLHLTYNLSILGFSMGWVVEPASGWQLIAAIAGGCLILLGPVRERRAVDISSESGTIS